MRTNNNSSFAIFLFVIIQSETLTRFLFKFTSMDVGVRIANTYFCIIGKHVTDHNLSSSSYLEDRCNRLEIEVVQG